MVQNDAFKKVLDEYRGKIHPMPFNNIAKSHGKRLGNGRDVEVVDVMRNEFELHIRRFGRIIKQK